MRLHLRGPVVAALLLLTVLCALRPGAAQSTFEILKSFLDGSDGDDPVGPMVQAADGWIYGLTAGSQNGTHCATAFRFHPNDAAGTFTTIWTGSNHPILEGCRVNDGGLVAAGDGNLYFTTLEGGPCNSGRVFQITPPATVVPLVTMSCAPGALGTLGFGVTVGADGALYGTAHQGGPTGRGGVYRVALDGSFSQVATFAAGTSGQRDALVSASDGRLYGTAANFNLPSFVYRVEPSAGMVEVVYTWPVSGADGYFPRGRLLELPPLPGHDIAFVGVTQGGGTHSAGVVYRLDVAGTSSSFQKLHEFNLSEPYLGETPMAGLVRVADGTLYGTTYGYGLFGGPGTPNSGELGTVFRISAAGVVEKLFGGAIQPWGPLLIGDDGDLYGTSYTGPVPLGALFRIRLSATKITPLITWPTPADIAYGTPLGPAQLNAIADVPGTFVYTPPAGTVLDAGLEQALNVVFDPTDTDRYETTAASVSINVTTLTATTTTVTSQKNPSKLGQLVKVTAIVATTSAGAGTPMGIVNFFEGSVLLGSVSLDKGKATFSTSALTRGSHSIQAVYSGSPLHQTSTGFLRQQVN